MIVCEGIDNKVDIHREYREMKSMESALIAMSGGVDSSVAALLIKEAGYDCMGGMMKLFQGDEEQEMRENSCCSLEDAEDARAVAYKLGIPFHVFNFKEAFQKEIMDHFVETYYRGETPNPCIDCNRYMKFERMLQLAREIKKDYVVTGHYASREKDSSTGRILLKKSVDASKDQSYVLYAMTQEQLRHTLLPLGDLHKTQVREIALEHGFITANKHDSQDICFVQNGNYADFIEQYTGNKVEKGRFVNTSGEDMGEHKGIVHYTIGQRKGLGIVSETPKYVCEILPRENRVVVGEESELYSKVLHANDVNWIPFEKLEKPMNIKAKIRYKHTEQPARVWQTDEDSIRVEFDEPQRAITKGQAVVLYDGDVVVGGGTIV
jgi:tRNA (5-methylaminomethyl-2-thiouridylate)-methyltransferase